MLSNSPQGYGLVSRALHWLMVLLILGMIGLGLYMTGLPDDDPSRRGIYGLHKSFGILVLTLAVLRILWIRMSRPPELPGVLQAWERGLARIVTGLLYLLMLATPVVGYLMSSAGGHPVNVFGLFDLPSVLGKNKALAEGLAETHELLAMSILGLAALHTLGALKHRYLDRDPEADVLRRML